jgi:ribosomal protein L17
VTNIIEQERVITRVPKTEAVQAVCGPIITLGKEDMLRREERERAAREGREPEEEA